MLIWGYATRQADVPAMASEVCERCSKVTSHSVRAEWQIAHFYSYLRSVRWERWFAKCSACGAEHQLTPKLARAVRRMSKADPVPFWDRHGGELVGVLVLVAIVWGTWIR